MAKNVKGGKVEVEVTSKGSLKKLGKEARQAGKDVGSVAKNTAESDRRLKSLSQQTSNSTKAFSKQAQTISGGLVPIYATLAAQVFAVSAAFRFLQEASDFKNLIAGQEAYGAFTGTMYKKLANDIRRATSAQISYAEASQAAAIGIASGLNATQLSQLGEAAANVSLILGRDVTDSFNRLIRGVTKAEPELLDELGIVLRLDPALKKYAAQLGKTKEQLNAFERSQAVAAEVIGQAEEKFGKVQAIMDPTAFAFNQFAQAFNDLMDDLKVGLGSIAQTVLPFFTKNVGALIGALGLFAIPIVKQLLPNFQALEKQSRDTINSINSDIKSLGRESRTLDIAAQVAGGGAGAAKLKADAKKGLKDFGIKGDLSQRQIAAYRTSAEKRLGIAKNMNKKDLQQFKMHLRNLEVAEKASLDKRQRANTASELRKRQELKKTELFHAQVQRAMTRATQIGAAAMNKAFRAMGIIGLGLMFLDFGRMALESFKKIDPQAEATSKKIAEIGESAREADNALREMIEFRRQGLLSLSQQASQTAKAIQSIGLGTALADISYLSGLGTAMGETKKKTILKKGEYITTGGGLGFTDTEEGRALESSVATLRRLKEITADPQLKTALTQGLKEFEETGKISKEAEQNILKYSNAIVQLNQKSQALTRTQDKATESIAAFMTKFAPSTASGQAIVAFEDNIGSLEARIQQINTEIAAMPEGFLGADTAAITQAKEERKQYEDRLDTNKRVLKILRESKDEENRIALATEQTKTVKAQLIQDGSIAVAQENRLLKLAEQQLKIDTQNNIINQSQKLLNDKSISIDDERRKQAQVSLDIAKEKLATLTAEKDQIDVLLKLEQRRAALVLRGQTQQLGLAGMLGLGYRPGSDEIATTMATKGMTSDEAISYLQEQNAQLALSEKNLQTMEAASQRVGSALTDGIANALVAIVDGTKSAKEAFSELAKSVIADLTKMAIRMFIMNALFPGSGTAMAALPTTTQTPVPGVGPRAGGIMSSPGYMSFARGGVATGPDSGYQATLHGTEAVVPLGNSRSIPVEIKGTSGGVNNVTVNISTDGTVSTDSDAEETKAFGRQISNVVIREIEIQKRPGGLLAR